MKVFTGTCLGLFFYGFGLAIIRYLELHPIFHVVLCIPWGLSSGFLASAIVDKLDV